MIALDTLLAKIILWWQMEGRMMPLKRKKPQGASCVAAL
jgi:hypothetical protein